jgi:hypothetical protein
MQPKKIQRILNNSCGSTQVTAGDRFSPPATPLARQHNLSVPGAGGRRFWSRQAGRETSEYAGLTSAITLPTGCAPESKSRNSYSEDESQKQSENLAGGRPRTAILFRVHTFGDTETEKRLSRPHPRALCNVSFACQGDHNSCKMPTHVVCVLRMKPGHRRSVSAA